MAHIGTCLCNQIELKLTLPKEIHHYSPLACDCNFCDQHQIMYLSDPKGSIEILSTISIAHLRQGSGNAQFLQCENCEQVVAIVADIKGELLGAVNSECLVSADALKSPQSVQLKSLGDKQKMERWSVHWSRTQLSEPD